jgi:hypothetical protein
MVLELKPYDFIMLSSIGSQMFETQFHAGLTQRFSSISTERP